MQATTLNKDENFIMAISESADGCRLYEYDKGCITGINRLSVPEMANRIFNKLIPVSAGGAMPTLIHEDTTPTPELKEPVTTPAKKPAITVEVKEKKKSAVAVMPQARVVTTKAAGKTKAKAAGKPTGPAMLIAEIQQAVDNFLAYGKSTGKKVPPPRKVFDALLAEGFLAKYGITKFDVLNSLVRLVPIKQAGELFDMHTVSTAFLQGIYNSFSLDSMFSGPEGPEIFYSTHYDDLHTHGIPSLDVFCGLMQVMAAYMDRNPHIEVKA